MSASIADTKNSYQRVNQFFLFGMVPLLGIVIPNIANLIQNSNYGTLPLLLSYAWFILIAFVVWKGSVFIQKKLRKPAEQYTKGYYRIFLIYLLIDLLFTVFVSACMLWAWFRLFGKERTNWNNIFHTTWIICFCVILISSIYEIIFLRQEMEDSFLKVRLLEMDKIEAELNALKAQIDPHFIFNSLNTLSYLITNKPEVAKMYNDMLAKVYRYILSYKDTNLIFLKEELEFVANYFYLINIRYEDAVHLTIEIPDVKSEDYLIVPVSLQSLIENAIKHNDFSKKEPLTIQLNIQANYVSVKNKIRPKEYIEHTPGTGLKNLNERCLLITQRGITIDKNTDFAVRVPLLKS